MSDLIEEGKVYQTLTEEDLYEAYDKEPERYEALGHALQALYDLTEETPESKHVQQKVREFRKLLADDFDIKPLDGFQAFAAIMMSGGTYGNMMQEELSEEVVTFVARAIEVYCDRVKQKHGDWESPIQIKTLFKEEEKDEQ